MNSGSATHIWQEPIVLAPNFSIYSDGDDIYSISVAGPNRPHNICEQRLASKSQFKYSDAESVLSEFIYSEAYKDAVMNEINNYRHECLRVYFCDELLYMAARNNYITMQLADTVVVAMKFWRPRIEFFRENKFIIKVRNSVFDCCCSEMSKDACYFVGRTKMM